MPRGIYLHKKWSNERRTKQRGFIPWNKGRKETRPEVIDKLKLARSKYRTNSLGKRWKLSEQQRHDASLRSIRCNSKQYIVGLPITNETRQKISLKSRGNKYRLGTKHSPETRALMSKQRKGIINVGPKQWNWKGGLCSDMVRYVRERRNKLRTSGGRHTQTEWEELKKQFNYRCLDCGRVEPQIKLTKDHIVPIVRGGTDDIGNIQPLCRSCNSRKGIRDNNYIINYKLNTYAR